MAEERQDILLQITLDDQSAIDKTIQLKDAVELLKNQIARTKQEIKEYEKAHATNTVEYKNAQSELIKYEAKLKATSSSLQSFTNALVQSEKANKAETGSINQKRAVLSNLTAAYNDAANPSKELAAQIKAISDELKAQESALGNDTRSIGSYKQAIIEASKEAQILSRTFGQQSEEAKAAKKNLSDLKQEFEDFNKSTNQFDAGNNLTSVGNTVSNIGSTLSTATQEMNLFGSSSQAVGGALSEMAGGVGVIATLPTILKEAKIGMAGLAATTGIALGPLVAIGATIAALSVAFAVFSQDTTDLTRANMAEQTRIVQDRYSHEINLAKAAGRETHELEKKLILERVRAAVEENAEIKRVHDESEAKRRARGATNVRDFTDEQKEALRENLAIIFDGQKQIEVLELTHQTKLADDRKKANEKALEDRKKFRAEEKQIDIEASNLGDETIQAFIKAQDEKKQAWIEANATMLENHKSFQDELRAIDQAILNRQLTDKQNEIAASSGTFDQQLTLRLEQLNLQEQLEVQAAEKSGASIAAINAKYDFFRLAATAATEQKKRDIISGTLGQAAALFKKSSGEYKALAIGQATIDTYGAANAALKTGNAISPFFGSVAAALAVITGLANVAKISGVQFYDGGYTGAGDPRSVSTSIGPRPYIYHKDEYVVPHQLVDHPYVAALEHMRVSNQNNLGYLGGYAGGGFTGLDSASASRISREVSSSIDLADMIASRINFTPIVTVEDINIGQSSVRVTESRAVS